MNPDLPLVSVIVPVFNRGAIVGETIESALAQTYPNIELIMVDDGSSDDSPKVIESYAGRLVSIRQENQGIASARNNGFLRSKGDYIAWLDHDDLWNPEKIALQVAFMQRHPACAIIASEFAAFSAVGLSAPRYASTYYSAIARSPSGAAGLFSSRVDLATRALAHLPPGLPDTIAVYTGNIYDRLIWGNFLHPPTVMMTRAAALQAGMMDQRFGSDVDYEYLLRLAKLGEAAYIDYPLMRYRHSEGQISSPKNMAKTAQSLLTVMDMLSEQDPSLLSNPAWHRRIGTAHLSAAWALAEKQRGTAARHLIESLRRGVFNGDTARTLAKLVLPGAAVDAYRRWRHPHS